MTDKKPIPELIRGALREDIGAGDITSEATIPAGARGEGRIFSKQDGVVSGTATAREVFHAVDPEVRVKIDFRDGTPVKPQEAVMVIEGRMRSILSAERVALNFLGHLSGVATLTARFVKQLKGTRTKIIDTRKTTPLMRRLEKQAVVDGGGANHRMGLYDMVLIKENHIRAAGGILEAVRSTEKYLEDVEKEIAIEVETRSLDEVREALCCNIRRIMLDNMTIPEIKEAVKLINRQVEVEVSGGVNLENVRQIALCGVDFISVGAITHSVPVFDFSLLIG